MTNTNNNVYELPQTVTIAYFNVESGQNLTQEEWQQLHPKNNLGTTTVLNKSGSNFCSDKEGYGPCQNSLCGCDCSKYTCDCGSASAKLGKWGPSIEAKGRIFKDDIDPYDDNFSEKVLKASLEAVGTPKRGVSGQISASLFKYDSDIDCEMKFLGGTAGGEISSKGVMGRATADLYNVKTNGFQGRIGIGVDTGISLEEGLEVKAIGFGVTLGKQVGFSTPVGEIKIDTDNCVIQ